MTVQTISPAQTAGKDRLAAFSADSPRVRVGVAGIGHQTREHLIPALLGLERAQIRAVVDLVPDARDDLADRFGVDLRYERIDQMLDSGEIDCVVAACPPQAHEEISDACIEAGIPVFVEKPPATSTAVLTDLAAAAEAHNVVTGVGMNFRWAAPIQQLVALLASGEHGGVEVVSVRHVASKPRTPMWGMTLWRSFLLAQAIHPIDLLTTMAGSTVRTLRSSCRLGDDNVSIGAQIDFTSGAIGTLVTGTQAPRFEHRVEVSTTTGVTICLTDLTDLTIAGSAVPTPGPVVRGETRRWRPSPMHVGYERTGFSGELAAFLNAATTGNAFTPSLRDLVSTYQVMDQLDPHRSQR